MTAPASRRYFLITVGGASLGLVGAARSAAQPQAPAPAKTPPVKPAPLDPSLVQEFVRAGHADLEKTTAMLRDQPGLLNAAWDWGGGDFETAMGGAGHMGRPDIARFLLSKGARLDLFVAAMLGELGIIRAVLTAVPGSRSSLGPHGISLLKHAQAGGEAAKAVVEYLGAFR